MTRVDEYLGSRALYRIHDAPTPDTERGCYPVAASEAARWNFAGWGIFHAVQDFEPGTRRMSACREIRAIAIDIDAGDKVDQHARLATGPLVPSLVVETAGGFHGYWFVADCPISAYRTIVEPVVEHYQADRNAKDVSRILRAPDHLHQKDPDNPFSVEIRSRRGGLYRTASFVRRFPPSRELARTKRDYEASRADYVPQTNEGARFWDNLYHADQRPLLEALSGHRCVAGEHFSFSDQRNGKYHLLVDGKKHNTWIDIHGRIGSVSGGGPTVVQWIAWYGVPKRQAAAIVADMFSELKGRR